VVVTTKACGTPGTGVAMEVVLATVVMEVPKAMVVVVVVMTTAATRDLAAMDSLTHMVSSSTEVRNINMLTVTMPGLCQDVIPNPTGV